jgi:hypothetical protein
MSRRHCYHWTKLKPVEEVARNTATRGPAIQDLVIQSLVIQDPVIRGLVIQDPAIHAQITPTKGVLNIRDPAIATTHMPVVINRAHVGRMV